ncbi:hypothetical protein [Streptomyces malaysiensis]|uniref:hypothetical protein n=1 Tax=Streptomyces malaysiensis TaxID=92644 RepID=UPI001FCDB026|nr:hypothetical protein [Streptomyces malaysiensis]
MPSAERLLVADFDEAPASNIPWEQHGIYRAMAWFCESLKEDTNIGLRREIPGTAPTLYGGSPKIRTWKPHSTP